MGVKTPLFPGELVAFDSTAHSGSDAVSSLQVGSVRSRTLTDLVAQKFPYMVLNDNHWSISSRVNKVQIALMIANIGNG